MNSTISVQPAEMLQQLTVSLALVTDAVAVAIIAIAVLTALWRTMQATLKPGQASGSPASHDEGPRLGLARALALGLEFLLAADIMRTAVAPTWTEIGQLAAIAALRTALNFFIQREIDSAERRRATRLPSPAE